MVSILFNKVCVLPYFWYLRRATSSIMACQINLRHIIDKFKWKMAWFVLCHGRYIAETLYIEHTYTHKLTFIHIN